MSSDGMGDRAVSGDEMGTRTVILPEEEVPEDRDGTVVTRELGIRRRRPR